MHVDLRSDTVTRPGAAMREAMFAAPVGDDVFGDDPTVRRLQEVLAAMLGFEAALFFPSGTQSNLAALMSHCGRGDEYLVGFDAHTYRYEAGGAAVLGSIQPQPIPHQPDGTLAADDVLAAIKPDDPHFARTRLLSLENTLGGRALALAWSRELTSLAHARGLTTHLDGARLFNAATALDVSAAQVCDGFDSVSVCLSKGLGAPAGTVLVGDVAFIHRAHRARKLLGGGMRQVGLLAAAGLYALEHHVDRIVDDHRRASRLAEGLAEAGFVAHAETNMAFVEVPPAHTQALAAHLTAQGVLTRVGPRTRLVTHLDVDDAAIDHAIAAFSGWSDGAG